MPRPWKIGVFTVVPSPYQRDLFAALAARSEVDLHVHYLEAAAPDSPWPEKPLAAYEQILPGRWFGLPGLRRVHVNFPLPSPGQFDAVIMNTLMSATGQWLMRRMSRRVPWYFWGERLGHGGALHRRLAAPLHRARGIAGIGTLATRDYAARFPEPRHWNIPYHCEVAPFRQAPRPLASAEDPVTFLCCGQMIARKGVNLLLEAFAQLGDDSRARLLLVGREADLPGWLAELPATVRARVEYAGFQAPDALAPFFARADVFVLPSRYDGWGVVVNQALAAGLPLICTDAVGAAHDLIRPGENGLMIPAGELAPLTAALRRLLDEPKTRQAWSESSAAAADQWTPAAGAAKWVAAFEETLEPTT